MPIRNRNKGDCRFGPSKYTVRRKPQRSSVRVNESVNNTNGIIKPIIRIDFDLTIERSLFDSIANIEMPMIRATSGQRTLNIANVFLISLTELSFFLLC